MKNKMEIQTEVLQNLLQLDKYAEPKEQSYAYLPFHLAILHSDEDKVNLYINAGYDINIKDCWGRNSLYYAVFQDNFALFKLLAEYGADINFSDDKYDGDTLLHIAATEGNLELVKYLAEDRHININCHNKHNAAPISSSMLFAQTDVAIYLIEQGAVNDGFIAQKDVLMIQIVNRLKELNANTRKNKIISFEEMRKQNRLTNFLKSL